MSSRTRFKDLHPWRLDSAAIGRHHHHAVARDLALSFEPHGLQPAIFGQLIAIRLRRHQAPQPDHLVPFRERNAGQVSWRGAWRGAAASVRTARR
jgi:hypothetical protein